jgi:hypothetical protein
MKRLLCGLTVAATLWIAACSGGSTTVLPPPQGKYSTSSLNGTYIFTTNGEVFSSGAVSATPLARTGSFMANGSGGITGGVEDVNSAGSVTTAIQVTGGSYTVNADGRGTLTLQLGGNTLQFGIVLTSTSDGLMIDETSTSAQASTGSGNFIKQTGSPFTLASVAGSYVFDFAGLDASQAPESFVGEFTANNGTLNPGFGDINDAGTFSSGAFTGNLAADGTNPSFPLSTFGRGIAQINGSGYVFYIVDSMRVRFLSTSGGMLSGDAVVQDNTVPTNVSSLNGGFVFLVGGSSGNGGLTRIGRFTATGAIVSNVLVDTNNAGVFTQTTGATNASVTLDAANPGRGTVTFLGNGLGTPFTFVFYLSSASSGVIQETTQSTQGVAAAVADGSISAQSGSPFSSTNITGTYALNWSGLSIQQGGSFPTQDEEDLVGQATISSLALTGAADIFQFTNGAPQPDNIVGGSIVINGDGTGGDSKRSTMLVRLTKNGASTNVNLVVYFVSPRLALFANTSTSNTRIVAGILKFQQ